MTDPSFAVVVGALIRRPDGKILLIRHPRRGWEFPQGRMETNEDIRSALHREVLEETGVRVVLGPLAAVWTKLSRPQALILNFLADYRDGKLRPSEESPELGWFEPEDALGKIVHPVNRDRFQALLNYSGKTAYLAYTTDPYRRRDPVAGEYGPPDGPEGSRARREES